MESVRFPLFLLCALLVLGTGCARRADSPVASATQAKPQFPADDLNRPVNLKSPAKRVVAIGPGAVETMFALNAGGLLVGRDDYADFPTKAKQIAVAGNYQGPNIEQCLALRPDLIIVQGETSNRARFDDWQRKIGVPVAALTTTSLLSLGKDIEKISAWIGKPNEGAVLGDNFQAPPPFSPDAPRALVQTGDSPGWIAGSGTLVSDAVRFAGLRNIADELKIKGYQQVNIESLLVKQPDVVVVPSKKPRAQVLAQLRASGPLSRLKCVKRGRILVVDPDLLLRPGPRLMLGVEELKKQRGK